MPDQSFGGNAKVGKSVLHRPEQAFIRWATPRVPDWIRSHHLTLMTIPISLGIILFSFLAQWDINWLWPVSLLIALQWLTDSLDGAVGRARKEGLIRWGYYMDHLLDYFFLASILIGYMLLLPDHFKYLHFFILALFGGFMINSFLAMAATNKFRIAYSGVGPTEARIAFVAVNVLLIFFGKTYLAGALPYLLGATFLGLIVVIFRTQRDIWKIDMKNKAK